MRNRSEEILITAILVSGLIQGLVVVCQILGLIPSLNAWFTCTGTFRNPAHAACIITCAISALTYALMNGRIKEKAGRTGTTIASILLTFLAITVLICGCRACVLTYVTVILVTATKRIKVDKLKRTRNIILGTLAIVILAVSLYAIRPVSATSRLLIWRVCLDMISSSPITGNGPGSFEYLYLPAQAQFFQNHPDSSFILLANNTYQAYNEPLRIICEYGIPLFILITIIIILLLKQANKGIRMISAILLGTSLFLCIFKIPSILLLFCSLILISVSKNTSRNSIQNTIAVVLGAGIILSTSLAWKTYPIHESSMPVRPSYEAVCKEGRVWAQEGEFEKAEACFLLAESMIPGRLYATFCLFELYRDSESSFAVEQAKKVLEKKNNSTGNATLQMRAIARQFLIDNDYTIN